MSGFYPYNPLLGQTMQTDVTGVEVDKGNVAHFVVAATAAIAATTNTVKAATATSGDSTTVFTTGITQPAVPKNLTITAGGVDADVKAVQVTVTGTNYADEVITETFPAFTVNTLGTVVGSKAFKTVTSISVPAMDGAGVTIAVGVGEKLGLPYKLPHNTVFRTLLGGTVEGTAPTVTTSTTAVGSNTVDLNTALDGAKAVDVYLIV
jgi:hypothetical protein